MKKIIIPITVMACAWCLILPFTSWADIGNYYGTATITSPASLGTIDLAFNLDVSGTSILHDTSYIMLEKTLLFPAMLPQVGGKDVGPRVSGTASTTSFSLATDNFTNVVSGKTVTRKVTLDSATVTNDGASITGTYTETISGLTPEVITVIGSFIIVKPTVPTVTSSIKDLNGDGWLDLSEIRAGGKDANVLEFSDVSYAIHLYYNPLPSLKVGSPTDSTGQQTINEALAEFKNGQQ